MSDLLTSLEEYEAFVYSITDLSPLIDNSTLVVKRHGSSVAAVEGEVFFQQQNIRLRVREYIDFYRGVIKRYSYEVFQGEKMLYWYDPQPHEEDESLAPTLPHHKHIHPDIKHHRIRAPGISFDKPNLGFLISEIERWIAQAKES